MELQVICIRESGSGSPRSLPLMHALIYFACERLALANELELIDLSAMTEPLP